MMLERVSQMDENRNGVIEPDELQNGRGRFFIIAAAREAGMDPSQPLSVDRLRTALQNSPRFNGQGEAPANPAPAAAPKADVAKKSPVFSFPSNVPGFGLPTDAVKVPGFGDALAANSSPIAANSSGTSTTSSATTTSTSASSTPTTSSSTEATPPLDERVRTYASAYLAQRDTDKSGALEKSKDEWKEVRGDPEQIDTDHNGVITLDELIQRFANRPRLGGGGGGGPATSSAAPTASSTTSVAATPTGKAKRFLTPTERLPAGLPSWFGSADKNGDGQISMFEYSPNWTEAKAAEFSKYDLNHDGIITPDECLKSGKK
jgi:hypothetical protein